MTPIKKRLSELVILDCIGDQRKRFPVTTANEAMEIPLQIMVCDMPRSDTLDARIREKLAILERRHPRVTSCRVTIAEHRKHFPETRQFDVRIDLRAPGDTEIVVNRQNDQDLYAALHDAFASATRQLEDAVRQDTRGKDRK